MKALNEYLSTKVAVTPIKGVDVIFKILKEGWNINYNDYEGMSRFIKDIYQDLDLDGGFRMYTNDVDMIKYLKNESWCSRYVFKNIMDENIIDNIIDSMHSLTQEENIFTDKNDENDITIYVGDSFITIYNSDRECDFVFEKLENDEEVNPSIKTYYFEHKRYIELSNRRLLLELDYDELTKQQERGFDQIWLDLIEDYVNSLNRDKDIDIYPVGGGNKHVCIEPTYKNIHRYNVIKKEVEKAQDELLDELKWNLEDMKLD